MHMKIKSLYKKHSVIINYAFFGVCTTLVNLIVYTLMKFIFIGGGIDGAGMQWLRLFFDTEMSALLTFISNAVSWFTAVTFAYLTNRKFVFSSAAENKRFVFTESLKFYASRALTLLLELFLMWLFVNVIHFPDLIVKVFVLTLVIVINYILSKFFIFIKK